jgi:hypothetical protein
MNSKILIEAIGYTGSALVLVSFLMVSVVKLRIVNSIGSIIFTIYAFIIKSYPTAIMNLCLVLINVYYLIKMSNTGENARAYDLVKASTDDSLFKYLINRQHDDILKFFPGIPLEFTGEDTAYVVCHDGTPVGVLVGESSQNGNLNILLDYSIPEYRDFSIAQYLMTRLKSEGFTTLTYNGPDEHHRDYLEKTGFTKNIDGYIKIL